MSLSNVQLLLADVAFIIILARLLGTAAKLLGQPPVLGEILAGILLGPTFFHGTITKALFPTSLIPPLTALADIGLVLFMFVVGYEVDLRLIRGRERVAVGVSTCSVILPLGLGTALGVWLAHRNHLHHVSTFALFIGTAMAATAFPVLARILTDRGLHRTRIGGIALASAAIADVLAWALLAVVVALAGSSAQWKVLLAIPYAAAMFGIVRPLLRRLSRFYLQAGRLTPNILATVLAGLLLSCYATNWMGLHFIFGAFLFGVIMPRENVLGMREEILEHLVQLSVLVLLPIYFVVSGLSINLSTIGSSGLEELAAILVVAIVGKLVGAYLGAQLTGVRGRNAGVIATLMNTRGLTELVILGVGLQLHILTKPLYTLMVVMALVTTAMSGPLLKAIYPDRVMQRDLAAADRAQLAGGPAYRILVLIDRPETAVTPGRHRSRPGRHPARQRAGPGLPGLDPRRKAAGVRRGPGRRAAADDHRHGPVARARRAGGGPRRSGDRALTLQRRRGRRAIGLRDGRRARYHRARLRSCRVRGSGVRGDPGRRPDPSDHRVRARAGRAERRGGLLRPQRRRLRGPECGHPARRGPAPAARAGRRRRPARPQRSRGPYPPGHPGQQRPAAGGRPARRRRRRRRGRRHRSAPDRAGGQQPRTSRPAPKSRLRSPLLEPGRQP